MELLLYLGSFLLYAIIKILVLASTAAVAGVGLAAGFNLYQEVTGSKVLA